MKLRFYKNTAIFFDTLWCVTASIVSALAYFLGFEININTLVYYAAIQLGIIIVTIIVYLIYTLSSKTYLILTNGKIVKEKNKKLTVLVEYKHIVALGYYSVFRLLLGDPKGGHTVIKFVSIDHKIEFAYIPVSLRDINGLIRSNRTV